ncbi:hypothetical protein BJ085DRAFT_28187 [Dimargaris cristalligena]|uniref:PIN domain-containing protein n=1 Tax=Dimargaris cristalligena TaxID=215637 RepID=A0A4P9ZQ51_9FUNG|nr:hypothetical protein BJ085DRAFT_28187 [Dimargaris cristalligena]|eukprot:RKP35385.1 hypothetical protein BJ085DRAFT_28187 [Dimargaris cristalligena]
MPPPPSKEKEYDELLRAASDLEERITLLNTRARETDVYAAMECISSLNLALPEGQLQPVDMWEMVLRELTALRQRLQDTFELLLDLNIVSAADNNVDERLWKYVFHDHVELCRYHLRKRRSSSKDPSGLQSLWSVELQRTLDAAAGFYYNLLVSATSVNQLDISTSGIGPLNAKAPSTCVLGDCNLPNLSILTVSSSPCYDVPKKTWLVCLHRCLVYMGDIERYKIYHSSDSQKILHNTVPLASDPYHSAKQFYYQSIATYRQSGRPHAQLAILAAYSSHDLDVIYWYTLSLLLPYPSNNAWVNTQSYVKSSMIPGLKLDEPLESVLRNLSESQAVIKALENSFTTSNLLKLANRRNFFVDLGKLMTILIGRIWDISMAIDNPQDGDSKSVQLQIRVRLELVNLALKTAGWLLLVYKKVGYYNESALRNSEASSNDAKTQAMPRSALAKVAPLALWIDFYVQHPSIVKEVIDYAKRSSQVDRGIGQSLRVSNLTAAQLTTLREVLGEDPGKPTKPPGLPVVTPPLQTTANKLPGGSPTVVAPALARASLPSPAPAPILVNGATSKLVGAAIKLIQPINANGDRHRLQALHESMALLSLSAERNRHYLIIPDIDTWAYHHVTFKTWMTTSPNVTLLIPATSVKRLDQLKRGSDKLTPRAREVIRLFDDIIRNQAPLTNLGRRGPKPLNEGMETEFPLANSIQYRLYFMKPEQAFATWDQAQPYYRLGSSPPVHMAHRPMDGSKDGGSGALHLRNGSPNRANGTKATAPVVAVAPHGGATHAGLAQKPGPMGGGKPANGQGNTSSDTDSDSSDTDTDRANKPIPDILTHRDVAEKYRPFLSAVLYINRAKLNPRNTATADQLTVLVCTRDPDLTAVCTLFNLETRPIHRITL